MKFRRYGAKQGIYGTLIAFLVILFIMAIFFTYLSYGTSQAQTAIFNQFGSSIFNPFSDFTFANSIWTWWLIIILFAGILFVWRSSQTRQPGEDI